MSSVVRFYADPIESASSLSRRKLKGLNGFGGTPTRAEEERRGSPRRRSLLEDIGSLEVPYGTVLSCLVEESVVLSTITSALGDTLGGELFWVYRTTHAGVCSKTSVATGLRDSKGWSSCKNNYNKDTTRAMDATCLAHFDHARSCLFLDVSYSTPSTRQGSFAHPERSQRLCSLTSPLTILLTVLPCYFVPTNR